MTSSPNNLPHDFEQDIDLALSTLGSAQPPALHSNGPDEAFVAMNRRVLLHLDSAASTSRSFRQRWFTSPRTTAALTIATVCVCGTLLPILHSRHTSAPAQSIATSQTPAVVPTLRSLSTQAFSHTSTRPIQFATAPELTRTSTASQTTDIDPAFLPSTPAPEAPLTQQERLLVSMTTRRRKPMLMALLEPRELDLVVVRPSATADPMFAGFQPEPTTTTPQSNASTTSAGPDSAPPPEPQPPSPQN